jgi:hypothetical protein
MQTIGDIADRIRAEFVEMPGLRLTRGQVERLCGIESKLCQAVLDALVETQFLGVSADRYYARLSSGPLRAATWARASDRPVAS